jgi:cytochrome c oxidase subunit II
MLATLSRRKRARAAGRQKDKKMGKNGAIGTALLLATAFAAPALAQEIGTGQPAPWQLGLQGAVTPIMESIQSLHTFLLWIITLISLFVLGLLVWCVVKFNEKANPTPSKTTHNVALEVAWTVIPVLILVAIAIPSFRLLRAQEEIPPAAVTIKVTGKQWFWTVEYTKDSGGFQFDAIMLDDKQRATEIAKGRKPDEVPRLLAVDNEIVLPVNEVVRVQVTAADVMHAFAMPAFGIKRDAVPGRLNETWFKATREGVYYGQCSELCGASHAFMPAAIRIVSKERYAQWLDDAKKRFASTDDGRVRLADIRAAQ